MAAVSNNESAAEAKCLTGAETAILELCPETPIWQVLELQQPVPSTEASGEASREAGAKFLVAESPFARKLGFLPEQTGQAAVSPHPPCREPSLANLFVSYELEPARVPVLPTLPGRGSERSQQSDTSDMGRG